MANIPLKNISDIENPEPGDLAIRISGKHASGNPRKLPVMFWPCQHCGLPRWIGLANHKVWIKKGKPRDFCFKCSIPLKQARENHHGWKGGKAIYLGYSYIHLSKNHPFYGMTNSTHWIGIHRLVMAEKLGRFLKNDEWVHHLNGDRQDNRPENLALTNQKDHYNIHQPHKYRKNFK